MTNHNTKFKDGDLVLLDGLKTSYPENSLFKILKIRTVDQKEELLYPVHASGYRYDLGRSCDTVLLSDRTDKVLTDPAEIAYWLLKFESHSE